MEGGNGSELKMVSLIRRPSMWWWWRGGDRVVQSELVKRTGFVVAML